MKRLRLSTVVILSVIITIAALVVLIRLTQKPAVLTETQTSGTVRAFVVKVEDNAAMGEPIGCGDSLVPIAVEISDVSDPVVGSINSLLTLSPELTNDAGLYNALAQSDLKIESVKIDNGVAEVRLIGNLTLGGVCDNPRVQKQLEETVLQFPYIESVTFFVNGEPLESLLSGQ